MRKITRAVFALAAVLAGAPGCVATDDGDLDEDVQAVTEDLPPYGSIVAVPENVPIYPGQTVGTTFLTWTTHDANFVQMTGPNCLAFNVPFAFGLACPVHVDEVAVYTLHGDDQFIAAAVAHGRAVSGTITASPQTVAVSTGTAGTTHLAWSSSKYVTAANVFVSVDGAPPLLTLGGTSGAADWPYVEAGHTYTFSLRGGSVATSPLLASVIVTGVAAAPAVDPVAGSWWNPSRSGNGFEFQVVGNTLVAYWLSHDGGGAPVWYLGILGRAAGAWVGSFERYTWHDGGLTSAPFGDATLTLASPTSGTFAWTIGAQTGSEPIEPLVFGAGPVTVPSLRGFWNVPSESGWGVLFDTQANIDVAYLLAFDGAGQPFWSIGSAIGTGPSVTFAMTEVFGNLCPGCTGPINQTGASDGIMTVDVTAAGAGTAATSITGGQFVRPSVTLQRFLGP